MLTIVKKARLSACTTLCVAMLVGTAYAGPMVTFGPNDQGALQVDYYGQFQLKVRDTGSGHNNDDNTTAFNFRRNRVALLGSYGDILSLYVQSEFTEDQNVTALDVASSNQGTKFQLLDAVMRANFKDSFNVRVGKFKYNFSRENLEGCFSPLTLDRSLFIRVPFTATRNEGVAVWGNLFKDIFQYRVDAMSGRKAVSGDTAPSSSFRYSVRGHVSLLDPENKYGYKGTYLGKKKVLTIGAAYQFEPNIVYGDTVTKTDKKDYRAWTFDGFFEYPLKGIGTVTVSAAYEKVDLDDAYKDASPDLGAIGLTGQKNGWYAKAGYMLPSIPLQFFARYEEWRFAALYNIFDQKINFYGAGVNYYFRGSQNLKLTVQLSRTAFDKEGTFSGIQGTNLRSKNFNTLITQLQVIF